MNIIFVLLHLVALFVFFPALFITIPAHIFLVAFAPKKPDYAGKTDVNTNDVAVG